MKSNVTAVVCTKDRYTSSLPGCLIAIALQTTVPDRLIIYDDGEQKDLRSDPLYQNIFQLLSQKGIAWEVAFGLRKGQVASHQRSLTEAKTEYIWRIDDDNIPEANVLAILLSNMTDGVGAVGGLVLDPKIPLTSHRLASNQMEDIYFGLNVQWFKDTKKQEVEHLYSTFLYRKSAVASYCLDLSSVGHREETILTYEIKRNGWRLIVDPAAVTWHMRNSSGGIRSVRDPSLWAHDEKVFEAKLKEWGIKPKASKLVVLNAGLGDHLVFKAILPELKEKYSNIVIANCYPEVFADDTDVSLISISEAGMICNQDDHSVYKWMWDRNWNQSLEDAYRGLYL